MACSAAQACLCRDSIYVAENLGPAAQVAAGVSCVGWTLRGLDTYSAHKENRGARCLVLAEGLPPSLERTGVHVAESLGPAAQVAAGVSCVGWMAVSSGLIMLNKHLMSTDGFHFPMGLSLLGMGFSSIASYIACRARPDPVRRLGLGFSPHPEPACGA